MQLSLSKNSINKDGAKAASKGLISAIFDHWKERETHKSFQADIPEFGSSQKAHRSAFSEREKQIQEHDQGLLILIKKVCKALLGEERQDKNLSSLPSHPHGNRGSNETIDPQKMTLPIPVRLAGDERAPCQGRTARHWVLHGRSRSQVPQQTR